MGIEPKVCPSCKEKNNPTFAKCWKCGCDFLTGKALSGKNIERKYYESGNLLMGEDGRALDERVQGMSNDEVASKELGAMLYERCVRWSQHFLYGVKQTKLKNPGLIHLDTDAISIRELNIAFMWLVYDFLQSKEKYEPILRRMHTLHKDVLGLSWEDAEEELKHLSIRYEEYGEIFRAQPLPNFFGVAGCIGKNISGDPHVFGAVTFITLLAIDVKAYFELLGETVRIFEKNG